ncbi:toll/interleukin-1 receptor domain-containing protein [Paenibacillus sp. FSL H8-0283]|uniref:toll/interleukin-1 receptor domain-containing protein n=1 Tax=Paenibacillus sp. FSL H8-0283 TaxID=2921383 RepID=UPI003244190C
MIKGGLNITNNLSRDYVWECDYGVRKPVIVALEKLMLEQNPSSLQMVNIFTNSNPYCLEFFVVIGYDNPLEGHINDMKELMFNAGLRYRSDITMNELFTEMGNRRFNSFTLMDEVPIEEQFSFLFHFPEKEELESMGYQFGTALGNQLPVFLSHASKDKSEIEDLIPYLTGAGLPVWFDKINIDYGESITKAIQSGIKKSQAVIFWITNDFLNSNWCDTELTTFLSRHSSRKDVLIISVVNHDVAPERLELFLNDLKYFVRESNMHIEKIANEIVPSLKRYVEKLK